MSNPTQTLLRNHIVPPKATFEHFLKNVESRIAFDKLQDKIWRELLNRFDQPIKHIDSEQFRIIEVLGCIRYYIHKETGEINSKVRARAGKTKAAFEPTQGTFLAVHPFCLTAPLITAYIRQWQTEIVKATHRFITVTKFESIFVKSLLRAVRQSVQWKQLRYQVQNALGIDSQVLDIACRARIVRHKNNLDDIHLNRVIKHLVNYQQLNCDAPNLLWLYTLTLQEHIELPRGELIQALKKLCIKAGSKERGWRLISKSQLRDFAPAVEFSGIKWKYLIQYVQLHNVLDLNVVIPHKAAHLFEDPIWYIEADGTVTYRDVNLAPALLNSYINEAIKQTDINAFLTNDATAVFVWLAEAKPKLDSNQLRLGWQWLSQEANHWLVGRAAHAELTSVRWDCGLCETVVGGHRFTPLSNAWQVRQEALRFRHCADRYIDRCVSGTYRLYSVYDKLGKHKATLGLEFYEGHGWLVHQIKGFANKVVSHQLKNLAHSLSAGLDIVDEGAKTRTVQVLEKDDYSPLIGCGNANFILNEIDEAQVREPASQVSVNKVGRKLLDVINNDYLNRESACDADNVSTLFELFENESIDRFSSTGIYLRTVSLYVCSAKDEPDNVFAIEHISRGRIVGIKGPWSSVEYAKDFYPANN